MREVSPAARVRDVARNKDPERARLFGRWVERNRLRRQWTQSRASEAFNETARAQGVDVALMRQGKWSEIEDRETPPAVEGDLAVLEAMFGADWPRPPMPLDYETQMRAVLAEMLLPALERVERQLGRLDESVSRLIELSGRGGR